MGCSLRVLERDFSRKLTIPGGLTFDVQGFSHAAMLGPDRATINVAGPEMALAGLLGLVRCPVEVVDDDTDRIVWWGFVEEAEAWLGGVKYRATMKNVSNRVKVGHTNPHSTNTELAGVQEATETAWAANADSVTKYGQRELIKNLNNATAAAAANYRDTYLDAHKRPRRSPVDIGAGAGGQLSCRGWGDTLAWRHLLLESLAGGAYVFTDGDTPWVKPSQTYGLFMSFVPARTMTASLIQWYMRIDPTQPDDAWGLEPRAMVTAGIWSDNAGVPGTKLRHDDVGLRPPDIPRTFTWMTFQLSADLTLTGGTTYWVGVGRFVGTITIPNTTFEAAWQVLQDTGLGYAGGAAKVGVASPPTYSTPSPNVDIPFGVYGRVDSTQVIADIALAAGEFIVGSDIESTSGISVPEMRGPDANALDDIEELCAMGTTNFRRVLVDVKADRRLRIREEPAASKAADYTLTTDDAGRAVILDPLGNPVRPADFRPGVWLRTAGPLTSGILETDEESAFIETVDYDPRSNSVRLRVRGESDPADFSALHAVGLPRE